MDNFDKNKQRTIREGFAWIQYSVFDDEELTSSDIIVYLTLARFADNKKQECYPSKKTLVKYARLTEPTIRKSLYHLRDLGYIDINQKAGRVNYYQLNDPQKIYGGKNRGDTPKKEWSVPPKNKGTNNTYINNTNNMQSEIANSKELSSQLSPHKQFILFWTNAVKTIRGIKPVITGADAKNLKRILDGGIDEMKLEQMAVYFLYGFSKFSPSISTFLSAGVINGILDRTENDPNFWKVIERYKFDNSAQKEYNKSIDIKSEIIKLKEKLSMPFSNKKRTEIQEEVAKEERRAKGR